MFLTVMFIKIIIAIFVLNEVYSDDIKNINDNKKQNKLSVSTNTIQVKTTCKWQVGRIKQKQYGLEKIIPRKPNTYVTLNNITNNDIKSSTEKTVYNVTSKRHHVILLQQNPSQDLFHLTRFKTNLQTSTPSYIEFHYFDHVENGNTDQAKNQKSVDYKIAFLHPPLFLVRLNDAACHKISTPAGKLIISSNRNKNSRDIDNTKSSQSMHNETEYKEVNIETCAYTTSKVDKHENIDILPNNSRIFETTTAYDRIKFFEIYDSDTYPPKALTFRQKIDVYKNNFTQNRSDGHFNKDNNNIYTSKSHFLTRHGKDIRSTIYTPREVFKNIDEYSSTSNSRMYNRNEIPNNVPYISKSASWSDFPFVAVYTYEPAQVHCDCASISSHWLVSSAMCLDLHHKDVRMDGISAFVSYCSNNWRHPGRIAYVRQSILHPRFKLSDESRRKLYNIGVIQVANSMANTCNGWQPISLMSHQFVAGPDGTFVTAVGWGLDRYDTKYTTQELPLHPLMLYRSLVFSDTCPGNFGYSNAKLFNEESVKNVYCLSLPPYIKEENDTVHGSLLLVGGKLIALYFQEERRPWGVQSAQYTSIWRLIPWILDVAQETDEQDPLDTEI